MLLYTIIFIIITLLVIYFRPCFKTWSVLATITTIAAFYNTEYTLSFAAISSVIIAIIIAINIRPIRHAMLIPIYKRLKKILPKISETETLALNAGDVWYEGDIFSGKPDFHKLHKIKKYQFTAEEQSFLDNQTNTLCAMIDEWRITHQEKDLPVELWRYILDNGFFGLVIKKEYGGLGFSASAHSEIVTRIATRSNSVAVTVMVPNSLGPGELLHHYGTDEQKNYYLPKLAKGTEIPCFALTAPNAGSDATSITDSGRVCYGEFNDKRVLGIELTNIDKRYITLSPIATLIGLAFVLHDPDNLLNGIGRVGITCALLPRNLPGIEIARLNPLDMAFMNGSIKIKKLFIPVDFIIGGQKMAGEGWRMLVECLSIGRSISLPGCGVANAVLSAITTSAYAMIREQFRVSIGQLEGIEEAVAKISGLTYMLNAAKQFTVVAVDSDIKPSVASAIVKHNVTQISREIVIYAMDVHAGKAIILGPNNYLGRSYQAAPIGVTVEGANILTRTLMVFGQGAMRCHPYLRNIYDSLNQDNGIEIFDKSLFATIGFFLQSSARAIFHGVTCGLFANSYHGKFACYYKQITRLSSLFAFIANNVIFILGGELKRRERISARMGDIMSYLYFACATLKFFKDHNEEQDQEAFVKWSLNHCLNKVEENFIEVFKNFPIGFLGKIYKVLFFPFGKRTRYLSSDKLDHELCKSMFSNGKTRQMMKNIAFVPKDDKDILGRLEACFELFLSTANIRKELSQMSKNGLLPKASWRENIDLALQKQLIDRNNHDILKKLIDKINEIIQVDEFSLDALGRLNVLEVLKK